MTEIRIRDTDSADAAVLGDVPFFETEQVINHLKRWGVRFYGDGDAPDTSEMSAGFVVDTEMNRAYFEVLVGEL